eukprot:4823052-Alexandrium_andersonii.AAC.1
MECRPLLNFSQRVAWICNWFHPGKLQRKMSEQPCCRSIRRRQADRGECTCAAGGTCAESRAAS